MTTEQDDISEYDETQHDIIMSLEGISVGDRLGNRFVGECWVTEIFEHDGSNGTRSWLMVRYEGRHIASGEIRDYQRGDPVGLCEDRGYPDFGKPYFWRKK